MINPVFVALLYYGTAILGCFFIIYDMLLLSSKLVKIEVFKFSSNFLAFFFYSIALLLSFFILLFINQQVHSGVLKIFSLAFFGVLILTTLGTFSCKLSYKSSWKNSVLASFLLSIMILLLFLIGVFWMMSFWNGPKFLMYGIPATIIISAAVYFIFHIKQILKK